MISKSYSCDSCGNAVGKELRGWRTKMMKKEAKLMPLSDGSASETILCEKCLPQLGAAFAVKLQQDNEKPPEIPFPKDDQSEAA